MKGGGLVFLNVIKSGSEANGYVLQNDNEVLILECGCSFLECKKVLGFNVKKVTACLISHGHG